MRRLGAIDLELRNFSLHMSLNRRSLDVDDAPCKLDGERELNNAVV